MFFYSETIKNLFRGERKTATVVPRLSQPRERRGIKGYSRLASTQAAIALDRSIALSQCDRSSIKVNWLSFQK